MFVTPWAPNTEKTLAARLEYFKRLAASGIYLFIFVSPSNIAALGEAQTEFPNIVGLRSIKMEDLQTVQTIRSFFRLEAAYFFSENQGHTRLS